MGRFAHFDPSVLICSSSTGLWHLPKDTAKSWKLFEHSVRLVAEKLQLYFTTQNPGIPIIWEAPAKPSLYGYFIPHPTREVATEAINDSIDGFIVYTAYISFLIALCQCTASIWEGFSIEKLFVNAGIESHLEWVSGLLESGIGNFATTRRRVGSIVNVDQCDSGFDLDCSVATFLFLIPPQCSTVIALDSLGNTYTLTTSSIYESITVLSYQGHEGVGPLYSSTSVSSKPSSV